MSYIIFGFLGFRFCHIDQENVELQKNEWGSELISIMNQP